MKKAVLLILFVLIAFFAVVFSTFYGVDSVLSPTQKDPVEKTKLTFMNSWGGYDTKAGVLDQILGQFEKDNPNVTVTNESLSGDDFLPALKEKFATGDQPDVFGLWPGSDIRSLINAGKVADLTQLLDSDPQWKNSFKSGMWDQVTQNGHIYGLPVEIIAEGLFINKDLFEKYNVKIPQNYDDLVAAVKTFRQHDIIPIAFNCMPEGSYLFQNIAMSLGGKSVENPIVNGNVVKSYIDAMYVMRDLFKMGAFPDNDECFFIDSNTRDDLFIDKKAAMIAQGSWFIANCNSASVDFIPFPRMSAQSDDSLVYGLGCGTFYISEKAWDDPAKRAEAIKLLKCITSSNSSVQLAEQTGMISNVNIDSSKIPYNILTQKGINMISSAKTLVGPPDSYITRSVWENIIVKDFPDMLSGAVSPEVLWQRAIAAGADEE